MFNFIFKCHQEASYSYILFLRSNSCTSFVSVAPSSYFKKETGVKIRI